MDLDEVVGWEEIRRFLFDEYLAEERDGSFYLQVRGPKNRKQLLCVYTVDEARVVIESPFANASKYKSRMDEFLSFLGTVTHFGVRQKADLLMLTTMVAA